MKNKSAGNVISILSTALVFVLASVAFVLSFDALRALAESNGIAPRLSFLFPLAVDGFILAAALASLRANLHGERAWYPSALVFLFTLASVVLNVAHSNGVLEIERPVLATIVAAVPPLALVLASELLFAQIRSIVKERGVITLLDELLAKIADARKALGGLQAERQQVADEIKNLDKTSRKLAQRIKERQAELEALEQEPQTAIDALLAFYAGNPLASHAKAGTAVGRSRQWVGQQLARMEAAGSIRKNGSGVEILEQEQV